MKGLGISLSLSLFCPGTCSGTQVAFSGGVVKLYIAEGKDIAIEFPV